MGLNIIENGYDIRRDAYYCVFEYDGKEYYADLCAWPDWKAPFGDISECMIFKSLNRQITDAGNELYCKRDIPVTELQLGKCIKGFINNLNN